MFNIFKILCRAAVLVLVMGVTFIFAAPVSAADVSLQGEIVNGRFLVPMRGIFESLDAAVSWDADTRTVTGKKGDTAVMLTIDSVKVAVNGKEIELDVPATIIEGSTFVPARFIGESLGATVNWDEENKVAIIVQEEKVIRVHAPDTEKSIIKAIERIKEQLPFNEKDLQAYGVELLSPKKEVIQILGQPLKKSKYRAYEKSPDGGIDILTMVYPYGELSFIKCENNIWICHSISINEVGAYGPRNSQVGDKMSSIINKFYYEGESKVVNDRKTLYHFWDEPGYKYYCKDYYYGSEGTILYKEGEPYKINYRIGPPGFGSKGIIYYIDIGIVERYDLFVQLF